MQAILPIQGRFDKDIPDNFGCAEYRAERELLITIDQIIAQSGIERIDIEYFWDGDYSKKYIWEVGTKKSCTITSNKTDKMTHYYSKEI